MEKRLRECIDWLVLHRRVYNDADFAKALGKQRSFISECISGKRKISEKFVHLVCEQFPEVSEEWLLNGVGEIEKSNVTEGVEISHYLVPVLPVSARGGSLSGYSSGVKPDDCEYAISPIAGADMIIPVTGESMAPEYPNGSRIIVKKINDKAFIEWGKVYVLDTTNGAVIKEIRKGESDDEVVCVSLNPNPKYAPFTVRRTDIIGMYRVLMCMALK